MSSQALARRLVFALSAGILATSLDAVADAQSRADAEPWLVARGPDAARWSRVLSERFGARAGDPVARVTASGAGAGIPRARLALLSRIEALLMQARTQAAALRESEALSALAQAERACDAVADVPGAAAWAAEVQLQLGAIAAQAGLQDLASRAFRRAATLEPARRLRPAEAAPEVVALCARVHGEVELSPAGTLFVRTAAPGARAYLDDRELGPTPARVRAPAGRHLLRVSASGYASYGAFFDLLPGDRGATEVVLSEAPALEIARALSQALAQDQLARVPALLSSLAAQDAGPSELLLLETARDPSRALLVRCDPDGCRGPSRARAPSAATLPERMLEPGELAAARSWLARAAPARAMPERGDVWKRWYLWGGFALVATAGAVAAALAATQEPEQRLRVVVDPGGL